MLLLIFKPPCADKWAYSRKWVSENPIFPNFTCAPDRAHKKTGAQN